MWGYRPAAVDEAIAGRDQRIAHLERVAEKLSDRVVEREGELRELRAGFERVQGESDELVRALGAVADELAAVRTQARAQATRIRLKALRDAAEVSDRITDLARRPAEARDRLLEAIGDAIGRLGGDKELAAGPASNGHDPGAEAEDMFQGLVEVEVGPLSDFSQLVGFEDAASGISSTSQISVKRFAQGRATIEMNLGEPVQLLRELEERAPFEFRVRDTRGDRVVLDLDAE